MTQLARSAALVSAIDHLDSALIRMASRIYPLDLPQMFKTATKAREVSIALETAKHTMLAIRCFVSNDSDENVGEDYLRLYGFLQAIYLQQDGLEALSLSFLGSKTKHTPESGWWQLRRLRNLTAGHPVAMKHNPEKRVHRTLVRRLSENTGISLVVWTDGADAAEFIEVDFTPNLVQYFGEATSIVSQLIQKLESGSENKP